MRTRRGDTVIFSPHPPFAVSPRLSIPKIGITPLQIRWLIPMCRSWFGFMMLPVIGNQLSSSDKFPFQE